MLVDDDTKATLYSLAHRHKTASGTAFASGQDEQAVKHREFADALVKLAETAPEIPRAKR